MITKFDSSYVGTVDMENLGYLGTPINDRWYSNERAGRVHCTRRWPTPRRWTGWATTPSGWRSTISSPKAPSASPTC